MSKAILILALAVTSQVGLTPHVTTGDNLQKFCTDSTHSQPDDSDLFDICMGFLIGADQGLREAERRPYCLEPGVDYVQVRKIVVKFLDDHPEKLHKTAISAYSEAMSAAFPCAQR
jgi:hypothetical protein